MPDTGYWMLVAGYSLRADNGWWLISGRTSHERLKVYQLISSAAH